MSRLAAALALALAPLTLAAQVQDGVYLAFDAQPLASPDGAVVAWNGNAVMAAPDSVFSLVDTPFGPTLVASIELRGAIAVDVDASAGGAFEQTFGGAIVPLPAVAVTPTMAVLPFAVLTATLTGVAEPGMRVSITQDFAVPITVALGGVNELRLDAEPTLRTRHTAPAVQGGGPVSVAASVEATIAHLLVLPGAVLPGPVVSTAFRFDLAIDPAQAPWWDLDASLDALAGTLVGGDLDLTSLGQLALDVADAGAPFPAVAPPARRWSRAWDLGASESATSIAPLDDDLIVTGNLQSAGGVGWFARLAPDGTILWEEKSTFASFGTMRPEELHVAADGGLIAGGNVGLPGGPRVDRLTADGAHVWSRLHADGLGGTLALGSLVPRDDGGAVYAGSVHRGGAAIPVAVWIAPDGAVESALELNLAGVTFAAFERLVPAHDGGWAFAGWADDDAAGTGLGSRSGLVAKVDAGHGLVFARLLGSLGYDAVHDLAEAPDGTLAVVGALGAGPHRAWIAFVAPDGALTSSQHHSDASPGTYTSLRGIAALPGGGFVLTGVRELGSAQDTWLFQIDARGMPLWWKRIHGAHEDVPAEVRALADGVVLAGATRSLSGVVSPPTDLWAARAGVDGMLHFDPSIGFAASNPTPSWSEAAGAIAEPAAVLQPFPVVESTGVFTPIVTAAAASLLTL